MAQLALNPRRDRGQFSNVDTVRSSHESSKITRSTKLSTSHLYVLSARIRLSGKVSPNSIVRTPLPPDSPQFTLISLYRSDRTELDLYYIQVDVDNCFPFLQMISVSTCLRVTENSTRKSLPHLQLLPPCLTTVEVNRRLRRQAVYLETF